jgi:hypothetical protein
MSDCVDFIALYFRKYDRIYDPVANARAIEEQNAVIARRARLAALFPSNGGKRGA